MTSPLPPKPTGDPVVGHALRFARGPFEFVEKATTECGDAYRMELPGSNDIYALCHPDYFEQVLVTDVDCSRKPMTFNRHLETDCYLQTDPNGVTSVTASSHCSTEIISRDLPSRWAHAHSAGSRHGTKVNPVTSNPKCRI